MGTVGTKDLLIPENVKEDADEEVARQGRSLLVQPPLQKRISRHDPRPVQDDYDPGDPANVIPACPVTVADQKLEQLDKQIEALDKSVQTRVVAMIDQTALTPGLAGHVAREELRQQLGPVLLSSPGVRPAIHYAKVLWQLRAERREVLKEKQTALDRMNVQVLRQVQSALPKDVEELSTVSTSMSPVCSQHCLDYASASEAETLDSRSSSRQSWLSSKVNSCCLLSNESPRTVTSIATSARRPSTKCSAVQSLGHVLSQYICCD